MNDDQRLEYQSLLQSIIDQSEAMEDPVRFATDNMPGFARFLERNFAVYQFTASGVVGATAMMADHRGYVMEMPLHIEPRGITEPLEWIIRQK